MSEMPPTDPSLRRGYKTSEGLATIGIVLGGWSTNALILLDAINVPAEYEWLLVIGIALATAVQGGAYALARGVAKGKAAGAMPGYLEALEAGRVNSFNIEMQERHALAAAAHVTPEQQTANSAAAFYAVDSDGEPLTSPDDPISEPGPTGDGDD